MGNSPQLPIPMSLTKNYNKGDILMIRIKDNNDDYSCYKYLCAFNEDFTCLKGIATHSYAYTKCTYFPVFRPDIIDLLKKVVRANFDKLEGL